MENPNFLSVAGRLKRKCDDSDAVLERLHGVSLAPSSKKLRQEFGSTSHFNNLVPPFLNGAVPELDLCNQSPNEIECASPDVYLPEQSSPVPAATDGERAIVLYKPVNPPLFPGGPSAGSQLYLNANFLQSGILDASNMLNNMKEDDLSWLKAPKTGVKIVDLSEEEGDQCDKLLNNVLAVVPWKSTSPMNVLASQAPMQPSSGDRDEMDAADESLGVEAMEEDNDSTMDFVNANPSNLSTSFCYEPWQQYRAPQPHYSSIMWSH